MKIRFIVNPISGTGKYKNLEKVLESELDTVLFQYDICYTKAPKHANQLAQEAKEQGVDIVAAVGGDGTMNECAQALVNSNTALAVIPCGSGNGFAFHFGMHKQLKKAIRQLNLSGFKTIDTCTANGHFFCNVSGIGYDAHIAHLFAQENKRGFSNYMRLILREFRYPSRKYTLHYNGQEKEVNAFVISWANATQFGNNAVISPQSEIDDNLLDICVLSKFPIMAIPKLLSLLFNQSMHHSKYMEIIRCKEMVITGGDGLCHLDGEPIDLGKEIHLKLIPESLKVFVPHG